jgi:serine/threonine protein kinase
LFASILYSSWSTSCSRAILEAHGGIFHAITSYASAPNDIWALGVILVNLITGRNPWKEAVTTDPSFSAFLKDPDFLPTILHISPEANHVLKATFHPDQEQRAWIGELKEMVMAVKRWTMDEEEFMLATKAAREAGIGTQNPAALRAQERLYVSLFSSRPTLFFLSPAC